MEFFQYFTASLVVVFVFLSLLLKDNKKRLVFLFLAFLFFGTLSLLLFGGTTIILAGMVIIFFYAVLYLYAMQGEFYGKKYTPPKGISGIRVVNLILAVIFCSGIGILFYIYTSGYFEKYVPLESISIINFTSVINELLTNYAAAFLILISILCSMVIWFTAILSKENNVKEMKED